MSQGNQEIVRVISSGMPDHAVAGRVVEILPNALILETTEGLKRDDLLIYDMQGLDGVPVRLLYTVVRSLASDSQH